MYFLLQVHLFMVHIYVKIDASKSWSALEVVSPLSRKKFNLTCLRQIFSCDDDDEKSQKSCSDT